MDATLNEVPGLNSYQRPMLSTHFFVLSDNLLLLYRTVCTPKHQFQPYMNHKSCRRTHALEPTTVQTKAEPGGCIIYTRYIIHQRARAGPFVIEVSSYNPGTVYRTVKNEKPYLFVRVALTRTVGNNGKTSRTVRFWDVSSSTTPHHTLLFLETKSAPHCKNIGKKHHCTVRFLKFQILTAVRFYTVKTWNP